MEKGDLFWAKQRGKHPHPIVFLGQIDEYSFHACVISHDSGEGNIPMSQEHFHVNRQGNTDYTIVFDNSHLIKRAFEKEKLWLSSHEAQGRLTEEGISFIEQHIGVDPIKFKFPIWRLPSKAMDVLARDFGYGEIKDISKKKKISGQIFNVVAVAKDGQESTVFFNEKGEAVSETGELIQQAQAPAQEEPATPEEPTAPEQSAE